MFSRKQIVFFAGFLLMSAAVILTFQSSGYFGPNNHTWFDPISLSVIAFGTIINLLTLIYHGKAPEMPTRRQIAFLLKAALLAIILIQLLPVKNNFSSEYASPYMFMLVYSLGMLSFLLLAQVGIFVGVSALLLLAYSAVRKIQKRKKSEPAVKRASILFRLFRAVAGFYIRLLLLGIIFTGFVVDPKTSALATLCFLLMHTFINIVIPALKGERSGAGRSVTGYAVVAIMASALFLYLHSMNGLHGMVLPMMFIAGVGGMLYSLFTPRAGWPDSFNRGFRELLAFTLPVCILISASLAHDLMKPSYNSFEGLRKISSIGKVYDLNFVPGLERLYITTRNKPNVRYMDTRTGRTESATADFPEPRRTAVFPEYDKVLVGSVYGTREFSLDLKRSGKTIFSQHTIDIEKMGGNRAILAQEIVNNIMVYDVASGEKKKITLPLFWAWMYAVEHSEELEAFFVSDWFFSPYVHRVDQNDYRHITKSFNGYMNVGLCVMPARNQVLVSRPLNRRIDILNASSLKRVGTIPVEFGIREIKCDKQDDLLFALAHFQGVLSVVDLRTNKPALEVQVGKGARAISYDTANNILYIGTSAGIYSLDLKATVRKIR